MDKPDSFVRLVVEMTAHAQPVKMMDSRKLACLNTYVAISVLEKYKKLHTILSSSDVPTSLQPSCSRKDGKFFVSPAGTQYLTFIQKTSVLNIRFLVCRRYKKLGV